VTTRARILIVTSGPLCRNPRALKEAVTLGAAGYDLTVATVASHTRFEDYDRALLENAPFKKISVMLVPSRGMQARKTLSRLRTWFARRSVRYGFQSAQAFGPATELRRLALDHPAELTIVHTELGLAVGSSLLENGRRVAADIEDWHSEDLLPQERRHRPVRLLRKIEHKLINHCAYTSTTSLALAESLHERYGGRFPSIITNSFPLQPEPLLKHEGRPPQFFWFSQTIGPGRGLELFLAAWARTQNPSGLVLLGEPRVGYREHLLNHISTDHRNRILFHPLVSPAELPPVIADHDIGLALEQPFIVNRDLTITNKILQYLNAGLAIVASSTKGQREVIASDPTAGILVEAHETTAFARVLDDLLANPIALGDRRNAARRLAETKYCWERETPRLLALVADAIAKPITSSRA
jgi:glycosyltransferase involved in cell wall biosynthesis